MLLLSSALACYGVLGILAEAGTGITKRFTQSAPSVNVLKLSEVLFVRFSLWKFVASSFQAYFCTSNSRTCKSTDISQSSQLSMVPA